MQFQYSMLISLKGAIKMVSDVYFPWWALVNKESLPGAEAKDKQLYKF